VAVVVVVVVVMVVVVHEHGVLVTPQTSVGELALRRRLLSLAGWAGTMVWLVFLPARSGASVEAGGSCTGGQWERAQQHERQIWLVD